MVSRRRFAVFCVWKMPSGRFEKQKQLLQRSYCGNAYCQRTHLSPANSLDTGVSLKARLLLVSVIVILAIGSSGGLFAQTKASDFKGVNWADERDNFVDGCIYPSGIDPQQDDSKTQKDSARVLSQFKSLLGVNTVRFGINPQTVDEKDWWKKYRASFRVTIKNHCFFLAIFICFDLDNHFVSNCF